MFDTNLGLAHGQLSDDDLFKLRAASAEIRSLIPKRASSPSHVWELLPQDNHLERLSNPARQVLSKVASWLKNSRDVYFEKIWVVDSSVAESDTTVLPFLPHFDRKRTTKIMVYLSDVELQDGPMYIAKNVIPASVEPRRKSVINKGDNIVSDQSIQYDALTGPAGHYHIFDTNLPHYAGKPFEDGERQIIRFDFVHRRQ